jgi:RNA polymerase sigma-70 factor (ECF subfamily)
MNDSPTRPESLDQAVAGDEIAFASLVDPHRRALFRHCYQMLGSGADAEDAAQDTLERAWRRLDTFESAGSFGGWLHRIATNVCLDGLRQRRSRLDPTGEGSAVPVSAFRPDVDPEVRWVEPVDNRTLGVDSDPGDQIVRREDISLAFVAALQRLPPRQRAALLLVDVLGFSQAEVSDVLETTPSGVNSLLSRARAAARARPTSPRFDADDHKVRELLERYLEAWQLADIDAFVRLVTEDVRFSMPPMKAWFEGRDAVARFIDEMVFAAARPYGISLRQGWCNGQPAFATYEPDDEGRLVASGLQVLDIGEEDGNLQIQAVVSFRDAGLAVRCGLPSTINQPGG